MADTKLTGLTQINTSKITDLIYIVTYDDTGVEVSRSINVEKLISMAPTGVNRIISGQVIWTGTGFTHVSAQLSVEIEGVVYYSDGESITNDAPDASNPRFDVIFMDSSGLGIKKGTPAGSPTVPSLDNPDSEVATNIVLVTNGQTTPTGVVLETVYSENAQEVGSEWDTAENTSGARIDLANTVSPINLTKDIKTIADSVAGDAITFTHSAGILKADFNNLRMKFRSLGNWKEDYVIVYLQDGAANVAWARINKDTFNTKDTSTIVDVYLTRDDFTFSSNPATGIDTIRYLVVNGGSGGDEVQFQLDLIKMESGATVTGNKPTVVKAEEVTTDTTNFDGLLSSTDQEVQTALETIDDITLTDIPKPTGTKATPIDADSVPVIDSADSDIIKETTWAQIKAFLLEMDDMSKPTASKVTPVNADSFSLTDSADSDIYKDVTMTDLKAFLKTYFDGIYGTGSGDMILASIQTVTGAKTFEDAKLLLRNVADTFSSKFTNTNTAARTYTLQDKDGTLADTDDVAKRGQFLIVEFNPDDVDLAVGTGLREFQMPNYATTLTDVSVSLITAPTGSVATFDLNEAGVSVLSTKVTIDATEKTSETAAVAPVISDSAIAANAVMTIDIDTIGSGTAGAGGKMILYFNKA